MIVKIKLCVISMGVHLKAMTLSYSDNVSSVENEEQRSKDASLWYTTMFVCCVYVLFRQFCGV